MSGSLVTRAYTFVKSHQTIDLKPVHLVGCNDASVNEGSKIGVFDVIFK